MPNASDSTTDRSRFRRWVDLDPSSFPFGVKESVVLNVLATTLLQQQVVGSDKLDWTTLDKEHPRQPTFTKSLVENTEAEIRDEYQQHDQVAS